MRANKQKKATHFMTYNTQRTGYIEGKHTSILLFIPTHNECINMRLYHFFGAKNSGRENFHRHHVQTCWWDSSSFIKYQEVFSCQSDSWWSWLIDDGENLHTNKRQTSSALSDKVLILGWRVLFVTFTMRRLIEINETKCRIYVQNSFYYYLLLCILI